MTVTMFEFDSDCPDPPLPTINSPTHAELASVGTRCNWMFVPVFTKNKNEYSVESLSLVDRITSSSSSSSIHPGCKHSETGEGWVQKYGRVLHISVDPNSNGEIYLKFEKISGGENAIKGPNGRYFGGRMITVQPL